MEKALHLLKNHATAPEREIRPDSFVVTVIRNPYSRILSWFRYCLHGTKTGALPAPRSICAEAINIYRATINDHVHANQEVETLELLRGMFVRWVSAINNTKDKLGCKWVLLPMCDWLFNERKGTFFPDFEIRFEFFSLDLTELLACFNIATPVPHENASRDSNGLVRSQLLAFFSESDIYTEASRR